MEARISYIINGDVDSVTIKGSEKYIQQAIVDIQRLEDCNIACVSCGVNGLPFDLQPLLERAKVS